MLNCFQYAGVPVHPTREDDEWRKSLVASTATSSAGVAWLVPKIMCAVVIVGGASTSSYAVIHMASAVLIGSFMVMKEGFLNGWAGRLRRGSVAWRRRTVRDRSKFRASPGSRA